MNVHQRADDVGDIDFHKVDIEVHQRVDNVVDDIFEHSLEQDKEETEYKIYM